MRERLHTGLSLLALLLGFVHCGLALSAPGLSVTLLWFVGSGVAIVCAALSNLLRSKASSVLALINLSLQNGLILSFFCAAWLVFPAPQVIAGGALFGSMLLLTIIAGGRAVQTALEPGGGFET